MPNAISIIPIVMVIATAPESGLLRISIPVTTLRTPAAKVSRKPLHLPVRNERMTTPHTQRVVPSQAPQGRPWSSRLPYKRGDQDEDYQENSQCKIPAPFPINLREPGSETAPRIIKKACVTHIQNSFLPDDSRSPAGLTRKRAFYLFARNFPTSIWQCQKEQRNQT